MRVHIRHIVFLLLFPLVIWGQSSLPADTLPKRDSAKIVQILKADKLRVIDKDSNKLNMFVGHVLIRQGNTLIECDSVVQNALLNMVEAFGNVHINDADSVHTYSQYLKYLGDTRMAYLKKNVKLTDGKGVLTTNELEYDINSGIGVYKNNGKLVSEGNVLTSKEGFYYSDTREAYFIKDVKLVSPERTVATDTLLYNMTQEQFTIVSPTTINDGSTIIKTRAGIYDTKNGLADFTERTIIEDSTQQVIADNIKFDKNTGQGYAKGNVIYRDTSQGVTILSGLTTFNNQSNNVVATLKPVMIIKQNNDSLYVAADTLLSAMMEKQVSDTLVKGQKTTAADSVRYFQAWYNVRIFSDSLQAVCDSLYYSAQDSMFRMFRQPLVWSGDTQISSDTMYLSTRNQKPEQLFAFENAAAVSRTREKLLNQIKGNRINGQFSNGEIDFMRAKGGAESVYYLQDDDSAYFGMNYSRADAITMYFGKEGLTRVSWVNSVEGTTFPMNQIPEDKRVLKDVMWLESRRPKTRIELFQ